MNSTELVEQDIDTSYPDNSQVSPVLNALAGMEEEIPS